MVKVVNNPTFQTFDGKVFSTREDAEAYENENFLKQFVNLKLPQIEALLDPQTEKEKTLALNWEVMSRRIQIARLKRGEKRRAPNGSRSANDDTGASSQAA